MKTNGLVVYILYCCCANAIFISLISFKTSISHRLRKKLLFKLLFSHYTAIFGCVNLPQTSGSLSGIPETFPGLPAPFPMFRKPSPEFWEPFGYSRNLPRTSGKLSGKKTAIYTFCPFEPCSIEKQMPKGCQIERKARNVA